MLRQLTRPRHTTPGRSGTRPSILAAIVAVAAALAALLGMASAPSAAAAPIYGNWTITGPFGGQLHDSKGGWFDGLVYFDRTGASSTPYNWIKYHTGYIGPGGRKYYSYTNVDTGRCLSHTADIVFAKPCDYWDYSQWWSVEQVAVSTTYPPGGGLPITKWAYLMTSWTAPDKVITTVNDVAYLKPRGGSIGSPDQRLDVRQLIIPH